MLKNGSQIGSSSSWSKLTQKSQHWFYDVEIPMYIGKTDEN